jgi:hypothetical protein
MKRTSQVINAIEEVMANEPETLLRHLSLQVIFLWKLAA